MCIDSGPLSQQKPGKTHPKNQIETPATDDEDIRPPPPDESWEDYIRRSKLQSESPATHDEDVRPPEPAESWRPPEPAESYADYIRRQLASAT